MVVESEANEAGNCLLLDGSPARLSPHQRECLTTSLISPATPTQHPAPKAIATLFSLPGPREPSCGISNDARNHRLVTGHYDTTHVARRP